MPVDELLGKHGNRERQGEGHRNLALEWKCNSRSIAESKTAAIIMHSTPTLLLTIEEAACELRISPRTLARLTKRGCVPVVRLGNGSRLVRYDRSEIQKMIAECTGKHNEANGASTNRPVNGICSVPRMTNTSGMSAET